MEHHLLLLFPLAPCLDKALQVILFPSFVCLNPPHNPPLPDSCEAIAVWHHHLLRVLFRRVSFVLSKQVVAPPLTLSQRI